MSGILICEQCRKETARATKAQRFCPECRKQRDRESSRKSALAAYQKRKAEKTQIVAETFKLCEKCHRLISTAHGRKYCPDCAKEIRLEQMRELRQNAKQQKFKTEKGSYTRPSRSSVLFDLGGKSLAEVALEARTLGMSYGKYTSACFGGTIAVELAAQGISRDEAARLIAEAKQKNRAKKRKRAG